MTSSVDLDLARGVVSNVLRLTSDSREDMHPSWSPDGKRIAYSSVDQGAASPNRGSVRSKRPDGSGRETLIAGAVTPDLSEPASVTCSPDGGKILFVRNDDSRGPGGGWREDRNFYEAGADGSNLRKLSDAWGSFAV